MRGLRGASSGRSGHGASDAVQGDWRETFTAIQGLPQGVYAWTSVPHELDGITTMRYALARLVLADGDRGDLVLAHTTAGEAAAPTAPPAPGGAGSASVGVTRFCVPAPVGEHYAARLSVSGTWTGPIADAQAEAVRIEVDSLRKAFTDFSARLAEAHAAGPDGVDDDPYAAESDGNG